jgi:hypothetical protein
MTYLLWLLNQLVVAMSVLVALVGGQHAKPVPAPVPVTPLAPAVVYGPTPHCSTGMGVKADGSRGWVGVCVVHGQSRTLCCWSSQRDARRAVVTFQRAWRDAARARR